MHPRSTGTVKQWKLIHSPSLGQLPLYPGTNAKKIDFKLQSVLYDIYALVKPLVSISFKFSLFLENYVADLVAKSALLPSVNFSLME